MARLSMPFASLMVIAGGATMTYIYFFSSYFYDMDVVHLEEWMRVNFTRFLVNTPGCQIPDWDPFHPTVNVYYKNLGPFRCKAKPSLVSVTEGNKLVIDETVLSKVYNTPSVDRIACFYKPIKRESKTLNDTDPDNRFAIKKKMAFVSNSHIPEDYVLVECFHRIRQPNKVMYSEYFPLIRSKKKVEAACKKRTEKTKLRHELNVIIQGVDSISRLNFLRHFPRTHGLLRDLGAFELTGYTKVGENTFPNVVPLLTGNYHSDYYNSSTPDRFFDDLPFAWKEYSDAGYMTLLAEDSPSIATFNYLKKGFREPPTDYYLRPYALATDSPKIRNPATKHCLGNKMEMQVVFNYTRTFVTQFMDRRLFAFSWVARLTHDVVNYAGYADLPSQAFIRQLNQSGALNNSLLIFMSDHGMRFGSILMSYLGKFEERTPFLFLIFPEWFQKQFPEQFKRLRENQNRLTSPFDVHATLLDLLRLLKGDGSRVLQTKRGISLFHEIPTTRTCDDASIPASWCVCMRHEPVDVRDKRVVQAAIHMVEVINNKTRHVRHLCMPLQLSAIMDSYARVSPVLIRGTKLKGPSKSEHGGENKGGSANFLITIQTQPNNAAYEATVRYDSTQDSCDVVGDIGRNNLYGHQADCVQDSVLRLFCYCAKSR